MRILLFTLSAIVFSASLFSQNNLIVFSEDGKDFTLHVNGIQQNESPMSNVLAEDIRNGMAAVRVVFADNSAPDLSKKISFLDKNTEVTARITMTKKGYRLKYFGEAPIGTNSTQAEEIPLANVIDTDDEVIKNPESKKTEVQETVTMTTTVESEEIPEGESVTMGISIDGFDMNIDVNVDDDITSSQTTTTTTTTTYSNSNTANSEELSINSKEEVIMLDEDIDEEDLRCPLIMQDISRLKKMLEEESFSDDQLAIARQALRKHCIEVNGIIELAPIFTFEEDRLEFVKFCFDKTVDQEDFYQVNQVFEFSSSKEELDEFLENQ